MALLQGCLFFSLITVAYPEKGVSLICTTSNMTVYFERNSSIVVDVPSSNITLLDTNCHARSNQSHFILSTGYHICGTKLTQNNEEFIYENVATLTQPPPQNGVMITRKKLIRSIDLRCHLKRNYVIATDLFFLTELSLVHGSATGKRKCDGFSAWSAFSECSVSCGNGLQIKTRECLLKSQPNQCNGTTTDTKLCTKKPCTLTCAELVCDKPFEMCYETFNQSQPATCVCKPAYVSINNSCVTSDNIIEVAAFKLNITFQPEYTDLTDQKTTDFTKQLEEDIHVTLQLLTIEYVKIYNIYSGSVFVDFIILLKNDTNENRTTIYQKLDAEVKQNVTGNLEEYYPFGKQIVYVVGADLCSLDSDECNRTTSTCQPTPGVGLNYRCNCLIGYEQIDDLTCRKIPKPTTITTLATTAVSALQSQSNGLGVAVISAIGIGTGLLLILLMICLIMAFRRRKRRRETQEN